MPMEVSLHELIRIRNRLEGMAEPVLMTFPISMLNDPATIEEAYRSHREAIPEALRKNLLLKDMYFNVRKKISTANTAHGLDIIQADILCMEQKIQMMVSHGRELQANLRLNNRCGVTPKTAIQNIKHHQEANDKDPTHRRPTDSVNILLAIEEDIAENDDTIATMKLKLEQIRDARARANGKVSVSLNDEEVAFLREHKLLLGGS